MAKCKALTGSAVKGLTDHRNGKCHMLPATLCLRCNEKLSDLYKLIPSSTASQY